MNRIPQKTKQLFKQWGRRGGISRARRLSSCERSEIAARAACTRWSKCPSSLHFLSSVRLDDAQMNDPVYLEEILSEGTWKDWQKLYQIIADRPFGDTAAAVKLTCSSLKIYGAAALWQGILRMVQGVSREEKTD